MSHDIALRDLGGNMPRDIVFSDFGGNMPRDSLLRDSGGSACSRQNRVAKCHVVRLTNYGYSSNSFAVKTGTTEFLYAVIRC